MRTLMTAILLTAAPAAFAQQLPDYRTMCEGNACDAFLPALQTPNPYRENGSKRAVSSALGGLSGALIGNEIAGTPGAIGFGMLGAVLGYKHDYSEAWEEESKELDAARTRGDDIFYNPAHRLPLEAHWMYAGPAAPESANKK